MKNAKLEKKLNKSSHPRSAQYKRPLSPMVTKSQNACVVISRDRVHWFLRRQLYCRMPLLETILKMTWHPWDLLPPNRHCF